MTLNPNRLITDPNASVDLKVVGVGWDQEVIPVHHSKDSDKAQQLAVYNPKCHIVVEVPGLTTLFKLDVPYTFYTEITERMVRTHVLEKGVPEALKAKRMRPSELSVKLNASAEVIVDFLESHPETYGRDSNYRWFVKD